MKGAPRPLPVLTATRFDGSFTATCLANGVIGVTPGPNPLLPCKVLVSGFVYSHPLYGFENIALAPSPLGLDLELGGRSVRSVPDSTVAESQALRLETGELVTRLRLRSAGDESVGLEVTQFVSRSVPYLACQEVKFTAEREQHVDVKTVIDREGISGHVFTGDTDPFTRGWYAEDIVDQCLGFATDRGKLGIATVVPRAPGITRVGKARYRVRVTPAAPALFRIIAALVPDVMSPDPVLEAVRIVRWGEMLGFDTLRRDNREAWAELWNSRIVVVGNEDDQRALDAAFYYYHSSIHPSTWAGIPPFGLAHHDKYFGHNFWDMDMWMLIPALLTAPASARAIMSYRLRGLPAARRRAELFGYRGAQFPWEASIDGWESTPSCCPTGWAEQHVTPGVAIGVWEYQRACGDAETLRTIAWPVLQAVAEWIASRGRFTDRGFEIGHVMGPDEGITNLSNQTYFNLLSKMALDAAIECARRMGAASPASWQKIRQLIVIPQDRQTGIVLPFDPEGTMSVLDPELHLFVEKPVHLGPDTYSLGNLQYLFLHGCPVDERVFRATYLHEEKLRRERLPTGRVPGGADLPGFTTGPFAVCAAHFGDRRAAADLFRAAWEPFWIEPFGMTRECAAHAFGGFVTNNGSLLQTALLGFTGLRIGEGLQPRYPAALPAGWERIEIGRVWSRGTLLAVTAEQGRRARLIRVSEPSGPGRPSPLPR
jgi:hypothetical protein